MASLKFKGLDKYVSELEKLSGDAREYIGAAIYAGAGSAANAVRSEIQGLPVAQRYAKKGELLTTITSTQKAGLLDGFGITRLAKEGAYQYVKLGFAGYNGQRSKKYPQGQPNSIIARSVCSGTSFRAKNDFIGRAVKRQKIEEEMREKIEEEIERIMGGY